MFCRPISWTVPALLLLLLASGCRQAQLVSRPMTATEAAWAGTIQRSYPGWRPPFYLPDRADWQPRPRVDEELPHVLPDTSASVPVVALPTIDDPSGATSREPLPPAAEKRETVVDIALPAAAPASPNAPPTILPPVHVKTGELASPVSRGAPPEPLKPAPPTALDDVEFVPADAP